MEELPFLEVSNITEDVDINLQNEQTQLDYSTDYDPLHAARQKNEKDLLLCHLNINSIQNKFEELIDIMKKSRVQIMAVSESKIDGSYPDSQFLVPGYYLHRKDRKKGGGGVLMLVSSKIQSKRIIIDRKYKTIEPLALEIGLKSGKAIVFSHIQITHETHWKLSVIAGRRAEPYFYLGRNAIPYSDSYWRPQPE